MLNNAAIGPDFWFAVLGSAVLLAIRLAWAASIPAADFIPWTRADLTITLAQLLVSPVDRGRSTNSGGARNGARWSDNSRSQAAESGDGSHPVYGPLG